MKKNLFMMMSTLLLLVFIQNRLTAQETNEYSFAVTVETYTPVNGTFLNVNSADDGYASFTLPFSFDFAGNSYTNVNVCTNGWLSFTSVNLSTYLNDLNIASNMGTIIAPFWDDLQVLSTSTGISWFIEGSTPNRIATVQFQNIYRRLNSSELLNFQIKLYEGSNNIKFIYGDGFPDITATTTASIGIANYQAHYLSVTPTGIGTATYSTTTANNNISETTAHFLTSGTTYTFTPPSNSCPRGSALIFTDITTSGASVTWTPGGMETQWLLSYKLTTTLLWSNEVIVSTNPSYSLSGLSSSSSYHVRVRAFCGTGDTSAYREGTFMTPCDFIVVPWSDNFDTYTTSSFPQCWTRVTAYTSGTSVYPYIVSSQSSSSPNSMCFYGYNNQCIATPPFTAEVNTLELSFKLRRERANSGTFSIGAMSNPNDLSTFIEVATFDPLTMSTWLSFSEITFSAIPNGYHYIAFRQNNNTFWYYWLDDVEVTQLSPCPRVSALSFSDLTTTSATVSWTPSSAETQWLLSYKLNTTLTWSDEIIVSTNPSYTLSGLASYSSYNVRVRAICGEGDTSYYRIADFMTPCDFITIPWNDDFDSYSTGTTSFPTCWTRLTTYADHPYVATGGHVGNNLYFYAGNAGTYNIASTPPIDPSTPINTLRVKFWYKGNSATDQLIVGIMSNPLDIATFTPIQTILASNLASPSTWTLCEVPLSSYSGSGNFVAFRNNYTTNIGSGYLDEVEIALLPECPDVYNFVVALGSNASVTVSWDNSIDNPAGWTIAYDETTVALFDPETATQISVDATQMPYSVSNLTVGSTYTFAMRSACDGTWTTPVQLTIPITVAVPYSQNFENIANIPEFNFQNGPNGWYIGNATGNPGNSLYISDDNGVSNSYNVNSTSYSYAYIDVDFGNYAEYVLSFDWKAGGESIYDFIRIYSMPIGTNIPSNAYPSGAGIVQINTDYMNLQSTWKHENFTLTAADYANQIKRIVFFWKNDLSAGTNPPGAIDNISIIGSNCGSPTAISVADITQTGATVTWTPAPGSTDWIFYYKTNSALVWDSVLVSGTPEYIFTTELTANTLYNVYIRTDCGDELSNPSIVYNFRTACSVLTAADMPYVENFDTYIASSSLAGFPACWTRNTNYSTNYYPYISNSTAYSGSNSLYFSYGSTSAHVAAIAPVIDPAIDLTTMRISFKMRNSTVYPAGLQVGIMTDPANWSTFVPVGAPQVISAINTWESKEVLLDSYVPTIPESPGHYIAIATTGSGTMYAYIDDVKISFIPDCPDVYNFVASLGANSSVNISWNNTVGAANGWTIAYAETTAALFDPSTATQISVTATDMPYNIPSLTSGTIYTFAMQSACNGEWTTPIQIIIPLTVTLPYNQNFENLSNLGELSFEVTNNAPNAWYVGAATGNPGNSMYISNDGGISNAYSHTSTRAGASIIVDFGNFVEYELSFDWKGYGESSYYDLMRVYVMPVNMNIPLSPDYSNWPPAPATQLGTNYSLQNSWQHESITLPTENFANTTQKIAFIWYNDASLGTNPPIAVDNISIFGTNCGTPNTISFSEISTTQATVSWVPNGIATSWLLSYKLATATTWSPEVIVTTSPSYTLTGLQNSSGYNVRVRSYCGVGDTSNYRTANFATSCESLSTFPYSEDFDTYTNNSFPSCWTRSTQYGTTTIYPIITNIQSNSYPQSMYFNGHNECIATPYFAAEVNTMTVSLTIRKATASSGTFSIGAMNNPTDASSFIQVLLYNPAISGEWEAIEDVSFAAIPDGYHYLAFRQNATGSGDYHIDDIYVNTPAVCPAPANLTVVSTTLNSALIKWSRSVDDLYYIGQTKPVTAATWSNPTSQIYDTARNFTGLTAYTNYMIRIQAHCRGNMIGEWDTIYVTPTSINVLSGENIKLYPNPANNLLNIEFSNDFTQIELINLLGETIAVIDQINFSTLSYQRKASIDVATYPTGVYFVRLHSKEGFVTKKFIKN
ncbi:MAG: fibronectin type III domain-containing protein [Bacteroidales bacterium]|jgi:hypothetical protein|nr:fibronectin type III domain-containing protein [Bacteroidales bacterium]